jgi:phosphatidylserine decarboxylase
MMKQRNRLIAAEGYPFILALTILAVLFSFVEWFWSAALLYSGTFFVTWFFRNPERKVPADDGLVVSPADGRIIKVAEVDDESLSSGRFLKVSIFMNIFDVHVNRMPYSGTVERIQYHKGRFLSADLDKASAVNEKNRIIVRTEEGFGIVVIQIAGLIARRIACWIKTGMYVQKGERFGLIRFGSRVEVVLPHETRIVVKVGDRVKAGETPIGWLR